MPEILVEKFVRVPLHVDVIKVTEENMELVSRFVRGSIRTDSRNKRYINVKVKDPRTERQGQAHVGDRILSSAQGYKVYTPKAFAANFVPVDGAVAEPEAPQEDASEIPVNATTEDL